MCHCVSYLVCDGPMSRERPEHCRLDTRRAGGILLDACHSRKIRREMLVCKVDDIILRDRKVLQGNLLGKMSITHLYPLLCKRHAQR